MFWKNKKEKDKDSICGFLDMEGRFFKTREEKEDSNYNIEKRKLRRILEDRIYYYIRNCSSPNDQYIILQFKDFLDKSNTHILTNILEIYDVYYKDKEVIRQKYNKDG